MAIKRYKPTTAGQRGKTTASFEELTTSTPEKSLLAPKKKIKGSNMTIALLSIFLESFFDILKFVFLLATICFLGFIPLQIFIESLPKASVGQNIFFGTLESHPSFYLVCSELHLLK